MPLRVSIVTPSFNQGRFLEETIQSVVDQSYPALQYVVIDGGSTDDSPAILRRPATGWPTGAASRTAGQYDAINKGFALTNGEVMGWLNSDDKHTPWALSVVAEIFEAFPEIEWLTTLFPLRWDARGRAVRCSARDGLQPGRISRRGKSADGQLVCAGLASAGVHILAALALGARGRHGSTRAGKSPRISSCGCAFFSTPNFTPWTRRSRASASTATRRPASKRNFTSSETAQILSEDGGRLPGSAAHFLRAAAARPVPIPLRPLAGAAGAAASLSALPAQAR